MRQVNVVVRCVVVSSNVVVVHGRYMCSGERVSVVGVVRLSQHVVATAT